MYVGGDDKMIKDIADKLMADVVKEGKLTKELILEALEAAENEGYHIGYEQSEREEYEEAY